jgi:RNA polymerase sigma-70 factor, ECF subfamily
MDRKPERDVTRLLAKFRRGDKAAEALLLPLVFDELHRIAGRQMRGERAGHSLRPTAVVNELYLRLIKQRHVSWQNRAHFYAFAAGLMREILIDHARKHRAAKRGAGQPDVPLDALPEEPPAPGRACSLEDLIAIDETLTRLARLDPRQARIVELRFFAGLNSREIAEALDIAERTVDREWASAQAWMYTYLRPHAE